MRRWGLIGDVHAEDQHLATALRELAGARVERILCVGDLADGEGDLDRCVALLQEHAVVTVRGNHDRWLLGGTMRDLEGAHRLDEIAASTKAYIAALPAMLRLETSRGPLLLCHGFGKDDMFEASGPRAIQHELTGAGYTKAEVLTRLGIDPDVGLVVAGHTHARMAARIDQFFIANPGTLKRTHRAGFAILDVSAEPEVQFFDL